MKRLLTISIAIFTVLAVVPAGAQDDGDVPAPGPVSTTLSIGETIKLAAARNYRVLAAELEREAASKSAVASEARYVPMLFLEADYDDRKGLYGTAAERTRNVTWGGGVRWSTPVGSSVTVEAEEQDALSGNPPVEHGATVRLSLTQHLLKDGWTAGAFNQVEQSRLDAEIQTMVFRQRLNELLVDVERAYWDLAFAQADLEIKSRSVERARRQFEDTRENIARGILAEGDIYVVEENLVFFEQEMVRANESLQRAQAALARLLAADPATPFVAADKLEEVATDFDSEEGRAVEGALGDNPELGSERLRVARNRVQLAFDENQALPTLDLTSSLSLNGVGEGVGEPYTDVGDPAATDFFVGLTFEVPLFDTANDARVDAGRARVRQQLFSLKELETRVRFDVRDVVLQIEAAESRLELAKRRVRLAELKLEAQLDKYKNGIATLDEVVRFQRDVDSTLIAERRTRVELLNARARLRSTKGSLHRDYGVEVR